MYDNIYDIYENNFLKNKYGTAFSVLEKSGLVKDVSYDQMKDDVEALSRSMLKAGVKPGDRVVIYSENRIEWYVSAAAVFLVGAVAVPLYATASIEQQNYIVNDSKPVFAFVSKLALYEKIADYAEKNFYRTILFDLDPKKDVPYKNISAYEFFLDRTRDAVPPARHRPQKDDPAVFIYTSGTTGEPKGVVLTHGNIISNCTQLLDIVRDMDHLRYLSLLPLSHAYEFTVIHVVFMTGGTVIPLSKMGRVLDYIQNLKPNITCAVPRLFEKIYGSVLKKVEKSSPLVRHLFNRGMKVGHSVYKYIEKERPMPFPLNLQYLFYRKLVFEGIRKKTVNSISLFISGGAALTKEVAMFFNILGTVIVEGYGITESSPVVSCNIPKDRDVGTVGTPLKGVEVKISKAGELLVKGPTVMKEYYNKPEQTAEVFEDGWFRTGDIAAWTDNGKIKILGRIKDLIVMANGKNISPQKIEAKLKSTGVVESACIAGDEKKYLSAIIVPDFEVLTDYAKSNEIHFKDEKDLVSHPAVVRMIRKKVFEVNKTIEPHEAIKRYHVMDRKFTVEEGELTPTLKIKRSFVLKKYEDIFNSLYNE